FLDRERENPPVPSGTPPCPRGRAQAATGLTQYYAESWAAVQHPGQACLPGKEAVGRIGCAFFLDKPLGGYHNRPISHFGCHLNEVGLAKFALNARRSNIMSRPTRRQFLQTSLAFGAGVVIAGTKSSGKVLG